VSGSAATVKADPSAAPRAGSPARPDAFPLAALVALGLAFLATALVIYGPSLHGPFIGDDVLYLEHNPNLQLPIWQALPRVLIQPYFANWSPLHHTFLLLEWSLFGANPLPYRVVNLVLHAGASLMLVGVVRRAGVSRFAAMAAGWLFLAHPVGAEAVAWINQSKTLLCVLFALLSLERWLAHLDEPSAGRLAASSIAGVAALLAKPTAVTLPAVLLVAAWTHGRGRRSVQQAFSEIPPLGVAALITLALALRAQMLEGGVAPWFGGSPGATAQILPWIAWRYVRLTVVPIGLAHGVSPAPTQGWGDPRVWVPALELVAVALVVWLACRHRRRRWLGPVWFVALLLPVVQIVPMISVFANRYLYAALPGAMLFLADLGDEVVRRRGAAIARALAVAAVAATAALGIATFERARLWGDPEQLYREAVFAFPLGREGWTGLGAALHQRGDLDGAAHAYLHSLRVFPDDAQVRYLLGRVRLRQGDTGRALYDLEASLRIAPNHPDAAWSARWARRLRDQDVTPVDDRPDGVARDAPP
jgi:hypothetical protein